MALDKIQIGDTGTVAKAKIDAAFDFVDTHETKIGTAETDIDNVEDDIVDIKADIVTIEAEQGVQDGKITELENDIATAKADIVTLQGAVSGVDDDITALQTNIANIHDYTELDNKLKVTIVIEPNKNKRFLKKTATAQEITIDTTTSGGGYANGTIQIFLYDGSLTFVNTTAIAVVGDLSYNSPAVIEVKLMENYLVVFDASASSGIVLPPMDSKTYAMNNQEWKEIHESEAYYEIVDNVYDDIPVATTGRIAYNTTPVDAITVMSDQADINKVEFAMVGDGDYLYAFGGYRTGSYLNEIKRIYIPDGSKTTVGATLDDGVRKLVGIQNGTDILLFGGETEIGHYDRVLKFDTLTQTITDLTSGTAQVFSTITKDGDNVYLMANNFSGGISNYSIAGNNFLSAINFTPIISIKDASICAKSGKIYMFGGNIQEVGNTDKIWEVDVVSGNTTELDVKLPNMSMSVKSVLVGDDIYLVGNLGVNRDEIYIFNTISKRVRTIIPKVFESSLSYFINREVDTSKIYFRNNGLDLQNIYEFDTKYLYEGVYAKKSYGWEYVG